MVLMMTKDKAFKENSNLLGGPKKIVNGARQNVFKSKDNYHEKMGTLKGSFKARNVKE